MRPLALPLRDAARGRGQRRRHRTVRQLRVRHRAGAGQGQPRGQHCAIGQTGCPRGLEVWCCQVLGTGAAKGVCGCCTERPAPPRPAPPRPAPPRPAPPRPAPPRPALPRPAPPRPAPPRPAPPYRTSSGSPCALEQDPEPDKRNKTPNLSGTRMKTPSPGAQVTSTGHGPWGHRSQPGHVHKPPSPPPSPWDSTDTPLLIIPPSPSSRASGPLKAWGLC